MDKIAFIIVTYNGAAYIRSCVESIRAVFSNSFLIVIDNASTDNTREILQDLAPDHLVLSQENLGFGKANNLALRWALKEGFDRFFLVNQDTAFPSQDTAAFIEAAERAFQNGYGVVSPVHRGPDKQSLDFKFANYVSAKNAPGLLELIDKDSGQAAVQKVKAVNAAAWLMSRSCLEQVGIFDPMFPHYGEDTDYIRRMRYHGLQLGVWPNFDIVHDRPQADPATGQKMQDRIWVWALAFMKDINRSLLSQFLRLPLEMNKRFKRSGIGGIGAGFKTFSWSLKLLIGSGNLARSRRKCKQTGAFIDHG